MRCDIIIPIWNELDLTKSCIDHIRRNTQYPYRLILIDNGSRPETKEYLGRLKETSDTDIILIRNEENLGFVKAVNEGLELSDSPYVCVLNNDTMPGPGWLENMVDFANTHKDVGLINPQCNGHGDKTIEEHARILESYKGQYMEMNQCQGFSMLIKRELIDKIGILDESFGIGGYDDTDYSMRAHLAGYRCVCVKNSYVYHRLHGSFDKAGDRERWVRRNRDIYYRKWGKHLRLGLVIDEAILDKSLLSNAVEFAYGLMREWTWVHIWINRGGLEGTEREGLVARILREKDLAPHQNLRVEFYNLNPIAFSFMVGIKAVERLRGRMRDKRFDALIVSRNGLAKLIAPFAAIAGSRMIEKDFIGSGPDWENEGRKAALFIKNGRGEDVAM